MKKYVFNVIGASLFFGFLYFLIVNKYKRSLTKEELDKIVSDYSARAAIIDFLGEAAYPKTKAGQVTANALIESMQDRGVGRASQGGQAAGKAGQTSKAGNQDTGWFSTSPPQSSGAGQIAKPRGQGRGRVGSQAAVKVAP